MLVVLGLSTTLHHSAPPGFLHKADPGNTMTHLYL
jgi:hypothetical protein